MHGCTSATRPLGGERFAFAKNVACYMAAAAAALGVFAIIYGKSRFQLSDPWQAGDYFFTAFQIQSMLESGWFAHHPRAGMPFGSNLLDFPMAESWHFFLMKATSRTFGLDAIAVLNLHLILSFPLTALSAYFTLRQLGCGRIIAFAIGQLFTFLYFHYYRIPHAFLAAYYLVPLVALVLIRLASEPGLFFIRNAAGRWRIERSWRSLGVVVLALVLGSAGIYYAFFACFFFAVTAFVTAFRQRRSHAAVACLTIVALIVASGVANVWPSVQFALSLGVNEATKHDNPNGAETFGLRVVQMALPPPGHPLAFWEQKRVQYETFSPPTEGVSATLGFVGVVGFFALLAWPFARFRITGSLQTDRALALLTLSGVLLAATGGFGVVIAYWALPEIRAYNRISIFLAFFAYAAVALALQRFAGRFRDRPLAQAAFGVVILLLWPLALFDQNPKSHSHRYHDPKVLGDERAFYQTIESSLAPKAMIFQLPYIPFPEAGSCVRHRDYDHFRGLLYTKSLRWSYGACRTRAADVWQKRATSQPTAAMIETLALAGFEGLTIDRFGYEDNASKLEHEIVAALKSLPQVSANLRLVFFDLRPYRERRERDMAPSEWSSAQAAARQFPVTATLRNIAPQIRVVDAPARWIDQDAATIDVVNEGTEPATVRIEMRLAAAPSQTGVIHIQSEFWNQDVAVTDAPSNIVGVQTTLSPGKRSIHLTTVLPHRDDRGRPKPCFQVIELRIHSVVPKFAETVGRQK